MDAHFFPLESPFVDSFISFVDRNFDINDNVFIQTCPKSNSNFTSRYINNVKYILPSPSGIAEIHNLVDRSDRIFIHSCFGDILNIFDSYTGDKTFSIIWWGSDIASYIYRNIYNRMDTKTRNFILGSPDKLVLSTYKQIESEYVTWAKTYKILLNTSYFLGYANKTTDCLSNLFGLQIPTLPFKYSSPTELSIVASDAKLPDDLTNLKQKYEYVILLNHSGNPVNNHITLIDALSNHYSKNFIALCPLSYGASQPLIENFTKYGKFKLGKKFLPITDYIKPEAYSKVMEQVDILLMNTFFSGGLANIMTLLALGRKVYINKKNEDYQIMFKENSIQVFSIDSENDEWSRTIFEPMNPLVIQNNIKQTNYLFGDDTIAKLYQNILDTIK
jgi:hypothetical protein